MQLANTVFTQMYNQPFKAINQHSGCLSRSHGCYVTAKPFPKYSQPSNMDAASPAGQAPDQRYVFHVFKV
ncbi:hypothetical protein K439DRAFT_445351 [Ramaria rubella]|nr:hypothetical protein K439DRAFT_445351 [Ramaria rubella]